MSQEELLTTWQIAGAREMLRNVNRALSPVRDNLDPGLRRILDAIKKMDAAEECPRLRNKFLLFHLNLRFITLK